MEFVGSVLIRQYVCQRPFHALALLVVPAVVPLVVVEGSLYCLSQSRGTVFNSIPIRGFVA